MAKKPLSVETITHDDTRLNAPTAELEAFVPPGMKAPVLAAYQRRNPDLDPQLVWRGKDVADWSDLVVEAPPLYIQEKIHPKAIVEDLKRVSRGKPGGDGPGGGQFDFFADFNGVPADARTEFYAHEAHWTNRMILGDGLKVMASLAEREGLKGRVQCIYIDPPYGIKFNSNFQWSTTSRDVKDGKADHFSREPEQVKAFRDTWRDGIHSYLTYLRDRLTVARDLLTESGSIFVQINSENESLIVELLGEIFGRENFVANIVFRKKTLPLGAAFVETMHDHIIMFAKNIEKLKFRPLYEPVTSLTQHYRFSEDVDGTIGRTTAAERDNFQLSEKKVFRLFSLLAPSFSSETAFNMNWEGKEYPPPNRGSWVTKEEKLVRVGRAGRFLKEGASLGYRLNVNDWPFRKITNLWANLSVSYDKSYVVQTAPEIVQRCILMTTDPGDLVLDPTCGSGTTAYVAEQWGRRWITVDTSRVALALARARIMGARYPWYLLADSREGQMKEAEVTRTVPRDVPTQGRVRQGFVYKRVPHITLKSIANNAEIDTIWDKYQAQLEPLREALNAALGTDWQEWEIPREAAADWAQPARTAHGEWWALRIARQQEIDASIAARADTEYLYDQPYVDNARVRVAGPFTVESLSPHRVPAVDVDDSLFDTLEAAEGRRRSGEPGGGEAADFAEMVLANLKKSGVQQAHKADRLVFESLTPWPGRFLCAEGRVRQSSDPEGTPERRAAVLVGPEYGTVSRTDLTAAAREAMEAGFDLLIAAAFNFDAHASEFDRMGALTVLQARINPDLHMPDLANTGAGNLFTVFGEPDIVVHDEGDGMVSIEVAGIDMYKGGQIESGSADDIAVWFIDTDYNYESFFVRHAYFPGANDPYKALKTTLKAEIDAEAWESLKRTRSRTFPKPPGGRVAVKVINHLGDEVMKVVEV